MFTVNLDVPTAPTMTALTGDYLKAGAYSMKVTVKYTGAAATNTYEFPLTGVIQDTCLHEFHWQWYYIREIIEDGAIAERTHDLSFSSQTDISLNLDKIVHDASRPYTCSTAIETDFEMGVLVKGSDFSYTSGSSTLTINTGIDVSKVGAHEIRFYVRS